MRHGIIFAPQAARDFRRLRARYRAEVRDALETHLRHEPTKVSRSRIKRLKGLSQPQFRLRIGDIRVFYDVCEGEVQVLAIVLKQDADDWLFREGKRT